MQCSGAFHFRQPYPVVYLSSWILCAQQHRVSSIDAKTLLVPSVNNVFGTLCIIFPAMPNVFSFSNRLGYESAVLVQHIVAASITQLSTLLRRSWHQRQLFVVLHIIYCVMPNICSCLTGWPPRVQIGSNLLSQTASHSYHLYLDAVGISVSSLWCCMLPGCHA